MVIAVIDGMGGSIGHQMILELRRKLSEDAEIIALGANAIATGNMMKARANRGATGENAVRVCIGEADVIMGSISILIPNSMMGTSETPLPRLIEQAVELVKEINEEEGGGHV
jgi:hypothetical protein